MTTGLSSTALITSSLEHLSSLNKMIEQVEKEAEAMKIDSVELVDHRGVHPLIELYKAKSTVLLALSSATLAQRKVKSSV